MVAAHGRMLHAGSTVRKAEQIAMAGRNREDEQKERMSPTAAEGE